MAKSPRSTGGTQDIEAQFEVIRDDITALTQLFKEIGESKAGEARDKALAEASELLQRSQKALDETRRQATQAKDSIEDYITEKPMQSTLIALGLGVVIGWMTRR